MQIFKRLCIVIKYSKENVNHIFQAPEKVCFLKNLRFDRIAKAYKPFFQFISFLFSIQFNSIHFRISLCFACGRLLSLLFYSQGILTFYKFHNAICKSNIKMLFLKVFFLILINLSIFEKKHAKKPSFFV